MNKKAIVISWISFSISLVTLVVVFWKITPNSIVDLGTFIGIIAGFVGISVALLIGYQIYNAIEINQKLSTINSLNKELEIVRKDFDRLNNEQNEGFLIMQGRMFYKTNGMEVDAFLKFHTALRYVLSVDHKEDGYDWFFEELELCMMRINRVSWGGGDRQKINQDVDNFKSFYLEDIDIIKKHENFYIIKNRYENLMNAFENRLLKIRKAQETSTEKVD